MKTLLKLILIAAPLVAQDVTGDMNRHPNITPEPSTMILMGIGIAGLIAVKRLRK